MKTHILHLATALLLGASLLMGACSKDEAVGTPTEPKFPEPVAQTIAAGETFTIDIEPNLDWEVRIPFSGDAAKWFYLKDGSQQAYKIQGRSGKHSIEIAAQDQADYDSEHACDVTLKMWDSTGKEYSKVIATIKIGKHERAMTIYSCRIQDGDFAYSDGQDGLRYGYEAEPTDELTLLWPLGKTGYSMPLMVDANFKWNVTSELPAWLEDLAVSGGDGTMKVELRLTGNGMKYPVDGASATLDFGDGEQSFQLKVNLPSSRDMFVSDFAAESKFNHLGEVYMAGNGSYQEGTAYANITSIAGLKFFKFLQVVQQWGDPYLSDEEDTEWLTLTDSWKDGGEVVQSRRLDIGAAANNGDSRKVVILGVPASIAANLQGWQLLDETGGAIGEDYKQYIITTVNQTGAPGPVSPSADDKTLAENSAKFTKIPTTDSQFNWLKGEFGTPNLYNLTYAANWGHEGWNLVFATEYASFKRFNYDENNGSFVELTGDNDWLSYNDQFKYIGMSPRMDAKSEGAVVYYASNGDAIAAIYCIFDTDADIGGDDTPFSAEFAYADLVQGASLYQITADTGGEYYKMYQEFIDTGTPVYHLTYTEAEPSNAMLNVPTFGEIMFMPWGTDWVDYEPMGETQLLVSMDPTKAWDQDVTMNFYKVGDSQNIYGIIVCTYAGPKTANSVKGKR